MTMIYPYPTAFGRFDLKIESEDSSLRPFDAADEYLLKTVHETLPQDMLIVNDSHGALTVPLAAHSSRLIQDSFLSLRDIRMNCELNTVEAPRLLDLMADEAPSDLNIRHIVMKVPKSLDFFRFQLQCLSSLITRDCPVIAAGMNKYLPETYFRVFREFCPDGEYSRIVKKARCYSGNMTPSKGDRLEKEEFISFGNNSYLSYPGTFSHGRLDGGSRFLLEYLDGPGGRARILSALPGDPVIADPGCGTGILGLHAQSLTRSSRIILSDDSAMAAAAAGENARRRKLMQKCRIIQGNILEDIETDSVDLVVCNPPFHRGHRVSLETGFSFIRESSRVLKKGGMALFVVNRTLGYGNIMKKSFESSTVVRESRKYQLILCRR